MNKNIYLYHQSGISFGFNWFNSNNSWTGELNFLTSAVNSPSIRFQSGKILNSNNEFIYGLGMPKMQNTYISGNLFENSFNFFVNDVKVYSESGNFYRCSGISINWQSGYDWDDIDGFPKLQIYGDKPLIYFNNTITGSKSDIINVMVSGAQTNNGPFRIYSGSIGGDSFLTGIGLYSQSKYFQISGLENWHTGVPVYPGKTFNITIVPRQEASFDNIFIPLILYLENQSEINLDLVVNRSNAFPNQYFSIRNEHAISINNLGYVNAVFPMQISINYSKPETNLLFYSISGLNNNNVEIDGITGSFSGSWSAYIGENFGIYNSGTNRITGSTTLVPSAISQLIYLNINKNIQIGNNVGFTGAANYYISGNGIFQTGSFCVDKNKFRQFYTYTL